MENEKELEKYHNKFVETFDSVMKDSSDDNEVILDKDVLPTAMGIKELPSVLDSSLVELEGMNIYLLQQLLYDELLELQYESKEVRDVQLSKIFDRLFTMQPKKNLNFYDSEFNTYESRIYIDLISTPGISKLDYVREFLEKGYDSEVEYFDKKRTFLLSLYDYYDNHTEEQIEKINYILRSSSEVGRKFLVSKNDDYDLNSIFPSHFIDSFSKENLSLLYRFYYVGKFKSTKDKFANFMASEKEMFVISEMVKKIEHLGNSSFLLDPAIDLLYKSDDFSSLLVDFYDTNIGSLENEESFSKLNREEDLYVFRQLINYVLQYDSSYKFETINNVSDFVELISDIRVNHHLNVFGKAGYEKIKYGQYDIDYLNIYSNNDLNKLKSGILYTLYGLSLDEALEIKRAYGEFFDELCKGIPVREEGMSDSEFLDSLDESKMVIKKEDYRTLEVFKAILNVVDLDLNDYKFDEKVRILQTAYLNEIREKGFDHQDFVASSGIVKCLLNKMFINTYNKNLLSVTSGLDLVKVDSGVVLYDAGVKFDVLLTSLNGGGALYDDFVNMSSKWNTASMSKNQGLCVSHISGENLGVIDLTAPMLGFSNIPSTSLYSMGPNDIFSETTYFNLNKNNNGARNRKFIPCSKMSDETRYGYNEILLDRFMTDDEYNTIKIQPDFVVYYKLNDNFSSFNDEVYRRSLKMAKDFSIPILVIDVFKIKEHERNEILKMEEELFSNDTVDVDLFKSIMTRYINNYTGSLTLSAHRGYPEDFSYSGMEEFIDKVFDKVNQDDHDKAFGWLKCFNKCYYEEKDKFYSMASDVAGYKASASKFMLDGYEDYDIEAELDRLKTSFSSEGYSFLENTDYYINPNSMPSVVLGVDSEGVFVNENTYSPIYQVFVSLYNEIGIGTTFNIIDNYELIRGNVGKIIVKNDAYEAEELLVEDLISSYFLESCDSSCLHNSFTDDFDSSFNVLDNDEFDFVDSVLKSSFYSLALDKKESEISFDDEIVNKYVSVIENIDDNRFINIFRPVIDEKVKNGNCSFEELASRMINKKHSLRENFNNLSNSVKMLNNEVLDDNKAVVR